MSNNPKYMVCSICETAIPVLDTAPLFLQGQSYTCDTCKKLAGTPRQTKRNQIKVKQSWTKFPIDKPCIHCGTQLWYMAFYQMADREVTLEDSDIALKPGLEPIVMVECPNPECSMGWQTRELYLDHTPWYLRPPWCVYLPGVFPEFDEQVRAQDTQKLAIEQHATGKLRDPHETTRELLKEFHQRWWHEWQRRSNPQAGKGVKI